MVVLAIIVLLTIISWPAIDHARERSQRGACINNLREISSAKDCYAIENGKVTGDPVIETDLAPFFVKKYPICPASGVYTINALGTDPICNITSHTY